MMEPAPPADASAAFPPPGLADVGCHGRLEEAEDRGLVVLAMGLSYWVIQQPDGLHVLVDEGQAGEVRRQLALFEEENRRWPPPQIPAPALQGSTCGASLAFAVNLAAFYIAARVPGSPAEDIGLLDARAVISAGEWWRTVTALTLHADAAHLLANLAFGAFFGHFAARQFGAGLAWLLIVLCGAAGNALTAWVYRVAGHLALGASTAVFAALGLLVGAAVRTALDAHDFRGVARPILLRLAAGCALLALLGGGAQIDVVAHLAGFAAGLAVGFAAGGPSSLATLRRHQFTAGVTAQLLVAAGWIAAATAG